MVPVVGIAMQSQGTTQVIAHIMYRVERGKRVLENQLHVVTIGAQRGHFAGIDRFSLKENGSGGRLIESGQQTSHSGFAAATFANKSPCAPGGERQRGILNGGDRFRRTSPIELAPR